MSNSTSSGGPSRLFELFGGIPQAWRLFWSKSTPLWCKAIPVATLGYLIWPLDLLADPVLGLGQLDDLAVILLGMRLFVYVAGRDLVQEPGTDQSDQVIDAEFRVVEQDAAARDNE